jgi:acetyltransferase-like isoleucine patch superfamily enzyme
MIWLVNNGRAAREDEMPSSIAPVWEGESLVGPYAVIGLQPVATAANRRPVELAGPGWIGAGCVIGAHAVIYAGVVMGRGCRIGDGAVIRENVILGNRCVVGCHADIQYGATIGDDVRILHEAQVAGGTTIGSDSFIGPGVQMANDPHVAHFDLADYQDRGQVAPRIGRRVFVGIGAVLLPGVVIGDGAVISAGAVVTKDVGAGDRVAGVPARAFATTT